MNYLDRTKNVSVCLTETFYGGKSEKLSYIYREIALVKQVVYGRAVNIRKHPRGRLGNELAIHLAIMISHNENIINSDKDMCQILESGASCTLRLSL